MLFTEKYRPRRLSDMAGNQEPVEKARRWALGWEGGKPEQPLLIHGAIGTGKTSLAFALAGEFGWELVEMNASGLRDEESINKIAGMAGSSQSLSGKRKLILIDDVDGLQAKADKGGASAITKLLETAKQPVMLTCHDAWDRKLGAIRGLCTKLEFKKINSGAVATVLRKISVMEKLNATEELIAKISGACGGDLRSAINDLHAFNQTAERDREKNIFDTMRNLFKGTKYSDLRKTTSDSDTEHDTLKLWIDENIPAEFETAEEIALAFDRLSRADIFDARISMRQYWGFLRYSSDLMSAGVSLSRSKTTPKFVTYSFPAFLRSMGATKASRAMKRKIGAKLGKVLHCSSRDAEVYFSLVSDECDKDVTAVKSLYGLEDEEVGFLIGKSEKDIAALAEGQENRRRKSEEEKEKSEGKGKISKKKELAKSDEKKTEHAEGHEKKIACKLSDFC